MPNLTERRHVAFINSHTPTPHTTDNSSVLQDIKTNTTIGTNNTPSTDVNLAYNGAGWNNGTPLVIDCNGYRSIRIWGDISNDQLSVLATNANNIGNAGFWDSFDNDIYTGKFSLYYPDPPRYLKIINLSGTTITAVNLQYGRYK